VELGFDRELPTKKMKICYSSPNKAIPIYGNSQDAPLLMNGLKKYGIYT
jgi:hypothetical protein